MDSPNLETKNQQNNLEQPGKNFKNPKRIWVFLIIIFILAIFASLFFLIQQKPAHNILTNVLKSNNPKVKDIVVSERRYYDPKLNYPPYFPQELPLDKPLDIIQDSQVTITYAQDPNEMVYVPNASPQTTGKSIFNGQTITASGTPKQIQQKPALPATYLESTVSYVTGEKEADSIAAYKKYFADNGFPVNSETDANGMHVILAKKSRESILYSYFKNSIDGNFNITLVHTIPDIQTEAKIFKK